MRVIQRPCVYCCRRRTNGGVPLYRLFSRVFADPPPPPSSTARPSHRSMSVQGVDAPMAHSRWRSKFFFPFSSSVDSNASAGSVGVVAPPSLPPYTEPSPPAPDGPPPSPIPKAPSHRTMVSLPSSSGEVPRPSLRTPKQQA